MGYENGMLADDGLNNLLTDILLDLTDLENAIECDINEDVLVKKQLIERCKYLKLAVNKSKEKVQEIKLLIGEYDED